MNDRSPGPGPVDGPAPADRLDRLTAKLRRMVDDLDRATAVYDELGLDETARHARGVAAAMNATVDELETLHAHLAERERERRNPNDQPAETGGEA